MIIVPRHVLDDMIAHAREEAPVEACGLLAGVGVEVVRGYRLTNMDCSRDHFSLDPKEQFAAVKQARTLGLEILGVYHSHPETPARMSGEDLRFAFTPEFRYVIVSLMNGDPPEIRSFTVWEGNPVEEPVLTEAAS